MAKMGAKLFLILCVVVNILLDNSFALVKTLSEQRNSHVHEMRQEVNGQVSHNMKKRSLRHLISKRSTNDQQCSTQQESVTNKLKDPDTNTAFLHMGTFVNESKFSMNLAWAGKNDGKLLVSTTEEMFIFAKPSTLYQSIDNGKTFKNITDRIPGCQIRKDNGLQKHTQDASKVFVVCHPDSNGHSQLFITENGGDKFNKVSMDFVLDGILTYHPSAEHKDLILTLTSQFTLYLSQDGGYHWAQIKKKVLNVKWSTWVNSEPAQTVYVAVDDNMSKNIFGQTSLSQNRQLMKSADMGGTWQTVHDNVYTFGMEDKFLYTSVHREDLKDNERLMEVSTTGGKHWAEVQLPVITEDQFYSILDMSEGLIFLHVDNPGDSGHGTLYTSDATGVLFSQSLTRHLYPNYQDVTDFYKVNSMSGTYLASQLMNDSSIRTVITFDRGGEWKPVKRPINAPCKDETKVCFLQIHNQYSRSQGVLANPPYSVENAPGLLLVHGHVADALQTTAPDVYVTSDGGYTWRKALTGPHHYQIADQGGLLVAVPANSQTPNTVKFSTDEGNCWHEYKYTVERVIFTGLLTEPGNQEMTVAIWGYGEIDRQWRTFIIDFEQIIKEPCQDKDYTNWVAHSDNSKDGCLLGVKETYQKLRPESLCKNGHAHELSKSSKSICACTKEDYDCDYGYYRGVGQTECKRDPKFKGKEFDICERGHEEKLVVVGYHKIPGDQCEKGYQPKGDRMVDLHQRCVEGDKSFVENEIGYDAHQKDGGVSKGQTIIIAAVVILSLLAFLILVAYFFRKINLMSSRNLAFRYSVLSTDAEDREELLANDLEQTLGTSTSLYEDSSDDEMPKNMSNGGVGGRHHGNGSLPNGAGPSSSPAKLQHSQEAEGTSPKLHSYHDDSDDDLLE